MLIELYKLNLWLEGALFFRWIQIYVITSAQNNTIQIPNIPIM